jgi:hypothetical protein
LNNKVYGIHKKAGNNYYNIGGFLNFPIKEFIKLNYHQTNIINIENENSQNEDNSINDSINNSLNYSDDLNRIGQTLMLIDDEGSCEGRIISCLKEDYYDDYPEEVNFFYQIIKLKSYSIELRIQDMPSKEKFREIKNICNEKSLLILLIYNSSSRKSFNNLSDWIRFIYSIIKPKIVICGYNNKSDKREVSRKEGQSFAKKFGLTYLECNYEEFNYAKIKDEEFYVEKFNDKDIKKFFYNCVVELPIFEEKMTNINKVQLAQELFEKN